MPDERILSEAEAREYLEPLLGQLCWGVKQGIGSHFTLEVGAPARRGAQVVGTWSFLVIPEWRATLGAASIASEHCADTEFQWLLEELDGRKLEYVQAPPGGESSLTFGADLVVTTLAARTSMEQHWILTTTQGFSLACLGARGFRLQRV